MARYALIIGIAEYIGSFASLETPVKNANAIATLLDRYGNFNQVRRLPFRREAGQTDLGKVIQKPLTCLQLTRELQQFFQDADGGDVLLYYSGHGFTLKNPLSGTREGFLAASDCQVELNPDRDVVAQKNGISLYDLNALISQHQFGNLVVMLDCCNSGAFLESNMIRRDATAFGYQRDYYLITACRSSSKAYEGEDHSLLTQAILKGLSRDNASRYSGRISGDRLFDVVGEALYNSRQEPLRMGWGRWITLVQYDPQPEESPSAPPTFNSTNPYVGLKAFEPDQADYFYGRERAVRALLDRLNQNRFLAVIGPSGCGKSSLVKAGLLPELKADRIHGSQNWVVVSFTPGRDPLTVLSDALSQQTPDQCVVLFIDQFEELFTLCDNEEIQRQFIKRLNEETVSQDRLTRVILTMRGDFLDRCAEFQESADLINTQSPTTYVVTPLTGRELVEAIVQPALMHGTTFEEGLIDKILEDVADQQGALPLLQYALFELWKGCIGNGKPSRLLTIAGYAEIGGVKGALQRRADKLYQESFTERERALFWQLMEELVEVSEEKATRRRANPHQLPDSLLQIARKLADQRLLMIDDSTIEVTHEALLSEWSLLKSWIDENRDTIRLRRRLEAECQEWIDHSRSDGYLLSGGKLSAIEEWTKGKQPTLPEQEAEFLKRSLERRDREQQTQLEQERRLREEAEARAIAEIEKKIEAEKRAHAELGRTQEALARFKIERQKNRLSIATAISLAGLAALLMVLKSIAEQREAAVVDALISEPIRLANSNNQIEAMVATIQVLSQIKDKYKGVPNALKEVTRNIHEVNRIEGHRDAVLEVSFNQDGSQIISASFDKTVKVWSVDGKLLKPFPDGSPVWGAKFSSNNQHALSTDNDGVVSIWNISSTIRHKLKPKDFQNGDFALKADFNYRGDILAVAYSNNNDSGSIKIFRKDGAFLKTLKTNKNPKVFDVDFSPREDIVASANDDKTVKLWNVSSGNLINTFRGHHKLVFAVKFSPAGNTIASASWDGTIRLWSVDGKPIRVLEGHDDQVNSISFSSSGRFLASASKDETVRIWNVNTGNILHTFRGHTDAVNSVVFSSDEQTVVSASDDRTIRIWRINSNPVNESDINVFLRSSCILVEDYLKNHSQRFSQEFSVCEEYY